MSRSWHSELSLALSPDAVVASCAPGLWRRGPSWIETWRSACCDGQASWQSAAEILRAHAAELKSASRVRVLLSNALVHCTRLRPPQPLSGDELDRYVRHRCAAIFGDPASAWTVRATRGVEGAHLVACIDTRLIEAVAAAIGADRPVRLSIQPWFSVAYNRLRSRLAGATTWFVACDGTAAVVGHMAGGLWRSLSRRPLPDDGPLSLRSMLDREHLLQDLSAVCPDVELVTPEAARAARLANVTGYRIKAYAAPLPHGYPVTAAG